MSDERTALNAAFARHVAATLGPPAAYAPAKACPHGHPDYYGSGIGVMCLRCLDEYVIDLYFRTNSVDRMMAFREEAHANATNEAWHPEWRIGPGAPHDFCGSLDRTVGALLRLGLRWDVATQVRPAAGPPQSLVSVRRDGGRWTDQRYAEALIDESDDVAVWATALVQTALRVLADREEG